MSSVLSYIYWFSFYNLCIRPMEWRHAELIWQRISMFDRCRQSQACFALQQCETVFKYLNVSRNILLSNSVLRRAHQCSGLLNTVAEINLHTHIYYINTILNKWSDMPERWTSAVIMIMSHYKCLHKELWQGRWVGGQRSDSNTAF